MNMIKRLSIHNMVKVNTLFLIFSASISLAGMKNDKLMQQMKEVKKIHVYYDRGLDSFHKLHINKDSTIADIKRQIFDIANIPLEQQSICTQRIDFIPYAPTSMNISFGSPLEDSCNIMSIINQHKTREFRLRNVKS